VKNKELESYYGNFLDLFTTPGWKQLLEDLETTVTQLNDIRSIRDAQDLAYRQGQLESISIFLNFETSVRKAIDSIEEDENAL
jgi:hypothetical protein